MPRDTLGGEALAAAKTEPAAEVAAPRKAGLWRAMGPYQKTAAVGLALAAGSAGAALLLGPPPARWPAAVALSAPWTEAPKAEAAPVAQAPPQQQQQQQLQPAIAAPPGATAQRRPGARTIEGTPPAPVRLAGMAQPPAAQAPPAIAPAAAEAPAPPRPEPLAPATAATPVPRAAEPPSAAPAEPDPLADVVAAVQASKQDRARPPAAPPSPRQAEMAAMVTRLSNLTGEVAAMQQADRADMRAFQAFALQALEDIRARMTLLEARGSFAALNAAGERSFPSAPERAEPARRGEAAAGARRDEPPPGSPVLGPQSYVVTSASPFLATVAHRNPMPNQPPPPELRVGETVPGLGKVLGIAQEGTAWVVRTERGPVTSGPVSPAGR